MCFTGPHAALKACSYCHEPRLNPSDRPRKRFVYLPLIPRLIAMARSTSAATRMKYRGSEHTHESGKISDVFDGTHYANLIREKVVIDGMELPHRFFQDPRDVALGLSTDGFAPFKHRTTTCWPLILFNYNLPPEDRFHVSNIISLGVIPGPKKPIDMDSFLWPLVGEMLQLAAGLTAFDALSRSAFVLRAYIILVFGDIPAVSLLMRMKGHNGLFPCRFCKIKGLKVPGPKATTHYVPLHRDNHPTVQGSTDPSIVKIYDGAALPLRGHEEIRTQGEHVEATLVKSRREALAKEYGVKGVSILFNLSSLTFPTCFPYDFMHLIWENVIKNLILLWTGDFKGLDEGSGCYQIDTTVWAAIGSATAASGSTIPGCYGTRPPNFVENRSSTTADTWSFWTLYLGPVLLRQKFKDKKYYDHFIKLVNMLHRCLQFTLTMADISDLSQGLIDWVKVFEEYVLFLLSEFGS